MTDSAVSQLPTHQEGTQLFCNIDLLKRVLVSFADTKLCSFHALRCGVRHLITSQTTSNATITRNILVAGPESMGNSTWLVSNFNDIAKQNYYLAEDYNPDDFILREALRLRNTDIILVTDKLPDKAWWRSAQSRRLNVILMRSARVESQVARGLLECGASAVFALPSVKSWAVSSKNPTNIVLLTDRNYLSYTEQTLESPPEKLIVNYETPIELSQPVKKFEPAASRERVLVVVDGANLAEAAKYNLSLTPNRARINFQALISHLSDKGGREIIAKYITLREPKYDEWSPLITQLEKLDFTIIAPEVKLISGDDWDDLQIRFNLPHWVSTHRATTVILVSGDGGYSGTLHGLRQNGIRIEIVSIQGNTSARLLEFDKFTDLSSQEVPNILLNQARKVSGGNRMANGWVETAYQWLRGNFDTQGLSSNCSGEVKLRWQLLLNELEWQIIASFVSWQDRDRGTDGAWINSFVGTRTAQGESITPQQVERLREDALVKLGFIWNGVDQRATNKYYEANRDFQKILGEMLALHEPTVKLNDEILRLTEKLAESQKNEMQAMELARSEENRANALAADRDPAPEQTCPSLADKIVARDREIDLRLARLNTTIEEFKTEHQSVTAAIELNNARNEEKLAPLYKKIAEAAQSRQSALLFELHDQLQTEMEQQEYQASSSQICGMARLDEINDELARLHKMHARIIAYRHALAEALRRYETLASDATTLIKIDPETEPDNGSSTNLPAIYEPNGTPVADPATT